MTSDQDHDRYDVDVFIVGGPIGLTTACALGHHGVEYRIFEQRRAAKPYSRANNVWPGRRSCSRASASVTRSPRSPTASRRYR